MLLAPVAAADPAAAPVQAEKVALVVAEVSVFSSHSRMHLPVYLLFFPMKFSAALELQAVPAVAAVQAALEVPVLPVVRQVREVSKLYVPEAVRPVVKADKVVMQAAVAAAAVAPVSACTCG